MKSDGVIQDDDVRNSCYLIGLKELYLSFWLGQKKSSPESGIYVLINGFTVSVQVVSSDRGEKMRKILKKCLASGKKMVFSKMGFVHVVQKGEMEYTCNPKRKSDKEIFTKKQKILLSHWKKVRTGKKLFRKEKKRNQSHSAKVGGDNPGWFAVTGCEDIDSFISPLGF